MRRTMFVVPAGLVPVVQAACTDDVARRLRRQLEKDLAAGGVGDGDPGGWLTDVGAGRAAGAGRARRRRRVGGAAVRGRAAAADAALVLARQELRRHLEHHVAGAHAARRGGAPGAGAPARRLVVGAVRVVRGLDVAGRPRPATAGWTAPRRGSSWRGGGCGRSGRPPCPTCSGGAAGRAGRPRRRWPRCRRPRWSWTGSRASRWRTTLSSRLRSPPVAALLPGLDPTPMGWQARDWFLGPHRAALFDRTGNIGPTVWWEGRVVGGWAQRASGEIVLRLLEDIGADGAAAVSGQAAGWRRGWGRTGSPRASARRWSASSARSGELICTSMYDGVHFGYGCDDGKRGSRRPSRGP